MGIVGSAVTLSLAVGAGLMTAGPASAGTDYCTYAHLGVPARVTVTSARTYVPTTMSTDCFQPSLVWAFAADWRGVAAGGPTGQDATWDAMASEPEIWNDPPLFVTDTDHLGRWTFHPFSGFSASQNGYSPDLTTAEMNSPTTDVRVGSTGSVTAVRRHGRVTIRTVARRYWTSTHAMGRWAGADGVLQFRRAGGSTWSKLRSFSSDARGRHAFSYRTTAHRAYRVVFVDAAYVWGSTSRSTAVR